MKFAGVTCYEFESSFVERVAEELDFGRIVKSGCRETLSEVVPTPSVSSFEG